MADPRRFLIDFLPIERRLVRRDGVFLHSIGYWADVLRTWIGDPEPMIVRYDPRDLSRIYLLGAGRSLLRPQLSRPAAAADQPVGASPGAEAAARGRPRAWSTKTAIFRTIEAMRGIADDAVLASKTARRQRERRLRVVSGGQPNARPSRCRPSRLDDRDRGPPDRATSTRFEEWS